MLIQINIDTGFSIYSFNVCRNDEPVAPSTVLWSQANVNFIVFPTTISPIDLSYENADAIEEFTVDFQVQYWEPGVYTKDSA